VFEKLYRDQKDQWELTVSEAQNYLRAADMCLFNAEVFLAKVQNLLLQSGYLNPDQVYKGIQWS
jgi:hypothetical protein